jgi:hypothetical protein
MIYIGHFDLFSQYDENWSLYYDRDRHKNVYRRYGKWYTERDITLVYHVAVNTFVQPDACQMYDQKLAALHTPVYSPGEIAGLVVLPYDLLPTVEYYLRALYPCVLEPAQSSLLGIFDNFDTANIEEFRDYDFPESTRYRGARYNGEEIILVRYTEGFWHRDSNGYLSRVSVIFNLALLEQIGLKFFWVW